MKLEPRLVFIALVFAVFTAHQVCGEKDCYDERDLVISKCMVTINIGTAYVNPSQSCIDAVEQSDMECVCRVITADLEAKISIMKILRLAYECHKSIPVGSKCGSKCMHVIYQRATLF